MKFRTQTPISKTNNSIDYNSKIVSLGSCFAVNIGAKFDFNQSQTLLSNVQSEVLRTKYDYISK